MRDAADPLIERGVRAAKNPAFGAYWAGVEMPMLHRAPEVIHAKVSTKLNNQVLLKVKAALKKANGSFVTVGVHEDRGSYAPSKEHPDPPRVSSVAFWLEYGTRFMPARPFLGPALDENRDLVKRKAAEGLVGIAQHGWSVERGFMQLGFPLTVLVQNKISSNVGPALSGSWDPPEGYLGYKRLKGFGQRTLIATGLLLRSVAYKMHLADGSVIDGASPNVSTAAGDAPSERDYKAERQKARQEALETKAQHKEQRAAHKANAPERGPTRSKTGLAGKSHKASRTRHGKRR